MKDLKDVIELEFKPKTNAFGWRVFELTGETNVAAVRGSSLSTYTLLPVQWAKQIVDAARPEMRFLDEVSRDSKAGSSAREHGSDHNSEAKEVLR